MNVIAFTAGCFCLLFQIPHWSRIMPSNRSQADNALWTSNRVNEAVEVVSHELANHEFKKIVNQYNRASQSIKSCEILQFYRAAAQCSYDVPGGLLFVREILKSSPRQSEWLTGGCCDLVISHGQFPRDQKVAYTICDEYAKITRYPSQAVQLRALVEDACGIRIRALALKKKAKAMWELESHADPHENPPLDGLGGIG